MSSSSNSVRLDPRRAGEVTRYHTWPRLREQSVGEHSWQVARILLMIWPSCPRTLLEHALFHDVGEVQTGDVPFPVKAQNAELKRIMTEMEFDAHRTMALDWGIPEPAHLPNADEKRVFKLCEFLEMWEWGLAEREMGNRRATLVVTRCIEQVWRLTEELERDENLAPIVERCRVLIRKRSLTHEATMEDGQYEC